jgi:hypothetical protein
LLPNDPGSINLDYIPTTRTVNAGTYEEDTFIADTEVFVAGTRLKKTDYQVYLNEVHPYSPEGDTGNAKEFSPTGSSKLQLNKLDLALRGLYEEGMKVVVIKRQGKLWNDMGKRLAKSNNYVANFLKNTPTVWPYQQLDKYE